MARPKSQSIPPSQAWYDRAIFGQKLQAELKKRNFSQEAFADAIGYSRETIAKIVSGERSPSIECYIRIISVLDFKDSELLEDFLQERDKHPPHGT